MDKIYVCKCGYYMGKVKNIPLACSECFRINEFDKNIFSFDLNRHSDRIEDWLFKSVVCFLVCYNDWRGLKEFCYYTSIGTNRTENEFVNDIKQCGT